jgi:hypothetical protein
MSKTFESVCVHSPKSQYFGTSIGKDQILTDGIADFTQQRGAIDCHRPRFNFWKLQRPPLAFGVGNRPSLLDGLFDGRHWYAQSL